MNSKSSHPVLTSIPGTRKMTIDRGKKEWAKPEAFDSLDLSLSPAVTNLTSIREETSNAAFSGQKDLPLLQEKPRFMLVKHEYKTIKIAIEDILFFQGKGNYVAIHTKQNVIVALLTMSKLEQILASYRFLRSHKSFIVSFDHIEAVWNDKVQIRNKIIPIGGQYRDKFLEYLNVNCINVNGGLSIDG